MPPEDPPARQLRLWPAVAALLLAVLALALTAPRHRGGGSVVPGATPTRHGTPDASSSGARSGGAGP